MKKVIFLAIAAAAALTACSKSEVIDSKYGNDTIGFQHYVGRDAQTKATVADETTLQQKSIGLYGFYTGNKTWTSTTEEKDMPKANLWGNEKLYWGKTTENTDAWVYATTKYWTNSVDNYTFLAYAPYVTSTPENTTATMTLGDGQLSVPVGTETQNPNLSYKVPGALADQIDVLYANADDIKNCHKPDNGGDINLVFKHALARLTVKASDTQDDDFTFHVKSITLAGNFVTESTFNLYNGGWAATKGTAPTTYTIYTNTAAADPAVNALPEVVTTTEGTTGTATDYAYYSVHDNTYTAVNEDEDAPNYLMMIPTDFSETPATLTVAYTTYYMGMESKVITKEFKVNNTFVHGKAYSINLGFAIEAAEITFDVEVKNWDPETGENDINAGNPENGTGWDTVNSGN